MKIIYKTPPKDTPKAFVGAAVSAGLGIYSIIKGAQQQKAAKEEQERLNANRPSITVPIELRQRAAEPIKREFMAAQEDAQDRRVSQSVGALERGGGRTLLGGLGGVMDRDRQERVQRNALYEQARVDASRDLGMAERDVQVRKESRWQNQAAATAGELNAGNQNVWTGINSIGTGVSGAWGKHEANVSGYQSKYDELIKQGMSAEEAGQWIDDYKKNRPSLFKSGGITDGAFDHKNNPLYLVDKKGDVKLEATGQETILNPEQTQAIAKESPEMRKLLKKFKTKAHKRKQKQNIS